MRGRTLVVTGFFRFLDRIFSRLNSRASYFRARPTHYIKVMTHNKRNFFSNNFLLHSTVIGLLTASAMNQLEMFNK
jgi:hypothetical protein